MGSILPLRDGIGDGSALTRCFRHIDANGIIRWNWAAPLSVVFTPPRPAELAAVLDALGG